MIYTVDLITVSFSQIFIDVTNVDDNAPEFEKVGKVAILEDIGVGQPVVRFKANDKDDSAITYRIIAGNEEDKFQINTKTGTPFSVFLKMANFKSCKFKKFIVYSKIIEFILSQNIFLAKLSDSLLSSFVLYTLGRTQRINALLFQNFQNKRLLY